jgi:hypothetical protein
MIIGVFLAAAVFGVTALTLLLIFRKDLLGVDLTARSLLRLYLYLASLAAVLVFAIGVGAILDWGMASVFGIDAVYGFVPSELIDAESQRMSHEFAQRMDQDLLRGLTLAAFGIVFWGGHRFARGRLGGDDERTSVLRRAYNVLGTFIFGVATVILLPVGIYQMLSVAILEPRADVFRQGFGDSLAGGLVSVPIWLTYLMRVVRELPSKALAIRPASVVPSPAR